MPLILFDPLWPPSPGPDDPPLDYTGDPPGGPPTPPPPPSPPPAPPPAGVTPGVVLPPTPRPVPRSAPTNLPLPEIEEVPRYMAADYAAGERGLMPRGRLWPQEADTVQGAVLTAIGAMFERTDAAANTLLAGSLPGELTVMMSEWEATLGLPDPCAGGTPTFAQRCDQIRGRFVGAGGQSRQHFIDFAAALGFTISITNYPPCRAGISVAGSPVCGDEAAYLLGVHIDAVTGDLPTDVLKCELEAIQPAEATLIFLN
jgi:uncharacterized protein YmfQ (DUF2313 family)